jgi:hypothetical protein
MGDVGEGLDKVEARLGLVGEGLKELAGEVGALAGRVMTLEGAVQKLRVLKEENQSRIRLIAEVQAHHGEKLEKIDKAVEPLADIHALLRVVVANHGGRMIEVEKRVGIRE